MNTQTHQTRPSGFSTFTLLATIIVVVLVIGGAVWLANAGSGEAAGDGRHDLFIVERGDFDITIPASGELAALNQIEIRNRLESQAIITFIVEEGDHVKKGDVLLTLNDEEISNRVKDDEDAVNTAENDLVTAQSNLDLKKDAHESEMERALLDVRLAELALSAWRDGDDVSKRQQLELDIETAQINYTRLAKRFEDSGKLNEKGFISDDEYKRDEIAMIEAKARLDQVILAKKVYIDYQYEQDKAKYESDVQQAKDALARLEQRQLTEIGSLQSDVGSRRYRLNRRKQRLAEDRKQLEYCKIVAPSDGMVVYASSMETSRWGRGGDDPPQIGTQLHNNQEVIYLPDMSKLVAAVKVNEALSGQIEAGQMATIVSDALPDVTLTGEVLDVSVLAQSGGWFDRNRRDYTVRILLSDGQGLGLKPSMRCKADIHVGRVSDAIYVPIQSVFHNGPVAYVYVPEGSGYAQTQVAVGRASELYVEIMEGLEPGDAVLQLEPSPERIVSKLDIEIPEPGANGRRAMPQGAGDSTPGSGPSQGTQAQGSQRQGRPGQGEGQGSGAGQRPPGGERPQGQHPSGGGSGGDRPRRQPPQGGGGNTPGGGESGNDNESRPANES